MTNKTQKKGFNLPINRPENHTINKKENNPNMAEPTKNS
jgi:hypothetical protein